MDIIFILIGINVIGVFLFDRSLLNNKGSFYKLLALNVMFFLIASICFFNNIGKQTAINALFIPLATQFLYSGLSILFYLGHQRNIEDTFWTMDKSLFRDGWYNFTFIIISMLLFLFAF